MEDEQNRHSTGFLRDHARSVDRPSPGVSDKILKDIENTGVTWEEVLLLMTDKQEWRSWIAQGARHGMD